MPEFLPLSAADCAAFTSETTSEKPKKNQIHLPDPRWSIRAYPRNDAVFNPRPHGGMPGGLGIALAIEPAGGVSPLRGGAGVCDFGVIDRVCPLTTGLNYRILDIGGVEFVIKNKRLTYLRLTVYAWI
jgi:hypothetical protein